MKAINVTTGDLAYAEVIGRYFEKEFSASFKPTKESLLEILTEILVGTKEYRFGNAPKPESLVIIRQTIQKAIEFNLPIPVLMPWGGRKPKLGATIDVAEVSALRQLTCVDEILKKYYEPGLHIHIRIEDLGADWLYRNEAGAPEAINAYSASMVELVRILRGKTYIAAIRESGLMEAEEYFQYSHIFTDTIFDYLIVTEEYKEGPAYDKALKLLQETGWKGSIPDEQRAYYTDRYKALYPEITRSEALSMLADYLAGALARYKLGGRAEPISEVGSYIQITFVPPVPGAPTSLFNNTLYYRTVGLSNARTHIAPWRAKGYLEIDINGHVKAKITSWGDKNIQEEVIPGTVRLCSEDGATSVEVCADSMIHEPLPIWAGGVVPFFM